MKRRVPLILALGCLMLHPGAPRAQEALRTPARADRPGFSLSVLVSRSFGTTHYTMDALTEDPRDPSNIVPIRSKLEFPLDAVLVGLTADWQPDGSSRWSAGAGFRISVYEPSVNMTDSDYFNDRLVFYTESDPETDFLMGTGDVGYRLRASRSMVLSLLLHIEYQHIRQYAVGFEGWQGSLFSDARFPVSETKPVLDYTLNYASSQVGPSIAVDLGGKVRLDLEATGGLLYAWDRDDHLLRERLSEGSGFGYALHAGGRVEWWPPIFGGSTASVGLFGELRYYRAEGGVDQESYANGSLRTLYTDLPYTLESYQPQAGVLITVWR